MALLLLLIGRVDPTLARQNLLTNGGFDTDLSGWEQGLPELVDLQWTSEDAEGQMGSGSLQATSIFGREGTTSIQMIRQCVPVSAGDDYYLTAAAFVLDGQAGVSARYQLAWFFTSCADEQSEFATSFTLDEVGQWTFGEAEVTAPAGVAAVLLALRVIKSTSEPGTVLADRIFFGPADGPRPSSCLPSSTAACIGDRFRVTVDDQTPTSGGELEAQAISLSPLGVDRGALFTFFSADNPELLIKVLDACSINGFYWVFYSAGTDVGFDVTVIDTETGLRWDSTNPLGRAAPPVQDTQALPCS